MFGLSLDAVDFKRRGFRGASPSVREHLERSAGAFLTGYHLALEVETIEALGLELNQTELPLRGFAYEGAAMGLALIDFLSPGRRCRIQEFLQGPGGAHAYMVHVGIGWVWARIPVGFRRRRQKLDPLLGWLAIDGWGFHEGFFHWPKYITGGRVPKRFNACERHVFDQGLGRSFWFVDGANAELIAQTISGFPAGRQPDLWSGIGLAAAYAGGIDEPSLRLLREKAGPLLPHLAQGAAFAAKARLRAGNMNDYTDLAAKTLCGLRAECAARVTDDALENLPTNSDAPPYEIWRRRIQDQFAPTLKLRES